MFKNQLQELAQRSCFNLPAYASIREGPDHAPRFKASVNFNGEIFESPCFCPTLRQAEHSAAQVALNVLSSRGSKSLNARVLDETGVYKSLLQETAHKAGLNLPVYTTIRSGPGHVPIFTCTVELAGMTFTGDSAKTKKQAEKYAAISAWSSLKKMPSLVPKKVTENKNEEQEQDQVMVTRFLSNFGPKIGAKPSKEYQRRPRNTRYWRSSENSFHKHKQQWSNNLEIKHKKLEEAHNVEKTSFVDLLPPPPPRTKSKILPLTSKVSKEQGHDPYKLKHTHQKLGQPHFENMFLGPSRMSNALKIMPLSCSQIGFMGVNHVINPRGVAPAVQIRSIIPVCAPPPPPLSTSSTISSSLSSNKPLSLNINTDQLSSEVSKLVLKEG